MTRSWLRPLLAGVLTLLFCAPPASAQRDSVTVSASTIDFADDGWPDLSDFLESDVGFMPVVVPITEPAVGYGAAFGPAFIKRPEGGGRPDITFVGGLATENGTWGVLAGDSRYWLDGRLQTLAGVLYTSVNLDYYGVGASSELADDPLRYNLAPMGGLVRAKYRLGQSPVWVGLGYALASIDVEFTAPAGTPSLPDHASTARVGGLAPSVTFDSRDNIFTPVRGTYADVSGGLFGPALGGEETFQRAQVTAMQFVSLPARLFLGVRGQAMASFGDAPFYFHPFVSMRGVQAMRYMGEEVAQLESELRWQCWKRISLVGFFGAGTAWNELAGRTREQTVYAGGGGCRYEIARRYGIHAGFDVAVGPDDPALYIAIGSSWLRP